MRAKQFAGSGCGLPVLVAQVLYCLFFLGHTFCGAAHLQPELTQLLVRARRVNPLGCSFGVDDLHHRHQGVVDGLISRLIGVLHLLHNLGHDRDFLRTDGQQ